MTRPTPEQQRVVAHPLEHLRVSAGAGTGKTRTIAHRLMAAVDNGVEPETVLGLTFSNKAASELDARVRATLAGRDERAVQVSTYHAFAKSLVDEFGPFAGVRRGAQVLSTGFNRQLLIDALQDTPEARRLDLTKRDTIVNDLLTLAGQLGDNLRLPEELLTHDAGDEVAHARAAMAAVLVAYEKRKRELGGLDYADLILLAHRLVVDHPGIGDRIRSRYRLVLLDEYQDTNAAQRMLLTELFADSEVSVTAVGDPRQTIYEWRGASLGNFADFPKHFTNDDAPASTIELTTNFRSDARIVALANDIEERITGDRGTMRERNDAQPGHVLATWHASTLLEANWIADEVISLHDDGIPWREMAVLFRKNAQIPLVRDALLANDVPIEVTALGGLLSTHPITDLYAWLAALGAPNDAVAIARLLLRTRFRLGLGDLAPLARWVKATRPGRDEESGGPPAASFAEAIERLDEIAGLPAAAEDRLREFGDLYHELLQVAQSTSLVELCLHIMHRTGMWHEVEALAGPRRLSARLNAYRFLDVAERWSPLEGRPSLDAFLDYLGLVAQDRTAEELDPVRLSPENAVRILTVHRSKGLEWDVVFLPALVHDTFPARVQQFDDPLSSPKFLPYELRRDGHRLPELDPESKKARNDALRPAEMAQEWRAAYVGATRARRRLYGSGARWEPELVKPRRPSELFALVAGAAGLPGLGEDDETPAPPARGREVPSPEPLLAGFRPMDLVRKEATAPGTVAQVAAAAGIGDAYAARVEQLSIELGGLDPPTPEPEDGIPTTSVTGLVTYATCPLQFRYREVTPLPRRPGPEFRYGTQLHRQIELHNLGKVPLDDALAADYDADDEVPDGGVESAFERFRSSRFGRERPLATEVPFLLKREGGRVRGRIDAIYAGGVGWEIVDYKSGRKRESAAMRTQLEAYALAADEIDFGSDRPERVSVTFAYFGGGAVDEVTEAVDADWMTAAEEHVDRILASIAAQDFEPIPSEACRSCDFSMVCAAGQAWLADH